MAVLGVWIVNFGGDAFLVVVWVCLFRGADSGLWFWVVGFDDLVGFEQWIICYVAHYVCGLGILV